jgi:hypothetical protein
VQPGPGTAALSWVAPTENTDGTQLTDLAGFRIYFGSEADALSQEIDVADPTATSYSVSALPAGSWYFAIAAYDSMGNESVFSPIASKTI